ncbi:MAG: glutamate--tRNA ligase [bacterium]
MIRTRMAPSPTGEYHIGHIRTLLFNYALAKKMKGKFIIRIEDTDRNRFVKGATERILNVIKAYGLSWDEGPDIGGSYGPYVQSERLEIYKKYALELIDKGFAYYCFCSEEKLNEIRKKSAQEHKIPKYDRHCRKMSLEEAKERAKKEPFVIRLKVPDNEVIEYTDLVMGKISINSDNLDDQILIKSDGYPTYHLAVVVDDHLMQISHVIRGSEWISSTPKHILLYKYFGWEMPQTGHITVFLDPSGEGKMSKRKGSVSAQSFLDNGFLPEAMLNFLALLGWSPKEGKEIFTLEEFIKNFDISDINKSNPIFDINKLKYFNGYYIRKLTNDELYNRLVVFDPSFEKLDKEMLKKVVSLEKERLKTLGEFKDLTNFFFSDITSIEEIKNILIPKGRSLKEISEHLNSLIDVFSNIQPWDFNNLEKLEKSLKEKAVKLNWRVIDVFLPIRVAVTGSLVSPPLFETIEILGKEKTVERIKRAVEIINEGL